ncbi:3-hydroxyacyl-[acyl-carrier-protein] dehydratase [Teratosphaeria destructans]|uniref:3-hydroxyacyl-[acyl-carrier-protein] dehydratase n=1 Tax=Teratosphaeria destructans TaxID=418781 RepID=A0A9W7W0T2_9PEZI|nr:3-hydroxyacyl-[acyl-carrier-protein] dehydratase [Teratosphaeria destructans]
MLPDGTNPTHSPGPPYTRRMSGRRPRRPQPLAPPHPRRHPRRLRRIHPRRHAQRRPGRGETLVGIERRLARLTADETTAYHASLGGSRAERDALDHRVRQRLWRPDETDFGPASLVETRNIVFMRAAPPKAPPTTTNKKLPPTRAPDWRHTIVPDARLLFRFSALTFNAHAIHLDPEYCRAVEGHRERLFHGPLSYVFMLTVLRGVLEGEGRGERVTGVEYRNLAPLYLGEPVTFCGARVGEARWEVWTETPEGGVAVKGTVATERA